MDNLKGTDNIQFYFKDVKEEIIPFRGEVVEATIDYESSIEVPKKVFPMSFEGSVTLDSPDSKIKPMSNTLRKHFSSVRFNGCWYV